MESRGKGEEKMSRRKDDKKAVNGLRRTHHRRNQIQIHFVELRHDFDLPSVTMMRKDSFVCKRNVRADKHSRNLLGAKESLRVRKQNNRIFDSIQITFVTVHPVLVVS